MNFKYYILLPVVWVCLCFPSDALGQYIKKETVNGQNYAVIYSDGLAESARWGPGYPMLGCTTQDCARKVTTVRHQVSRGSGGNPSVNDRIPFRFIVAPTDIPNVDWIGAAGVTGGNGNMYMWFTSVAATGGCSNYNSGTLPDGSKRQWRVPTQRELQLIWLFREPIGIVYNTAKMEPDPGDTSSKKYWASTEHSGTEAWYFDFKRGEPGCSWQLKTTSGNVRCVSDY